jgi:hypothetical protein
MDNQIDENYRTYKGTYGMAHGLKVETTCECCGRIAPTVASLLDSMGHIELSFVSMVMPCLVVHGVTKWGQPFVGISDKATGEFLAGWSLDTVHEMVVTILEYRILGTTDVHWRLDDGECIIISPREACAIAIEMQEMLERLTA